MLHNGIGASVTAVTYRLCWAGAHGGRPNGEGQVMTQWFWPAVAVAIVGLFMLVAGIGPLWLPIVVLLSGVAAAVVVRTRGRRNPTL